MADAEAIGHRSPSLICGQLARELDQEDKAECLTSGYRIKNCFSDGDSFFSWPAGGLFQKYRLEKSTMDKSFEGKSLLEKFCL